MLDSAIKRDLLRGGVYVVSIGLALHLLLPQLPGLGRSVELLVRSSPLLVGLAFLMELLSEVCYAELLGRAVGATAGTGSSLRRRRRRGIGPWFALRLTVTGYGASHVLPGGGAAAATVTYGALRGRGFDPRRVGLALAAISGLVYGALGFIFAGSLAYLISARDLGPVALAATGAGIALVLLGFIVSYAAYRRQMAARRVVSRLMMAAGRLLRRGWSRRDAEVRAAGLVSRVGRQTGAALGQFRREPVDAIKLAALALGYWLFDALCLVVMFEAFGVPAGTIELLVAYGVATAAGALPLTPGGIGVFETTMLATLALLGISSDAVLPILGYRLFNFWLPIPLAAVFYPTLRFGNGRRGR